MDGGLDFMGGLVTMGRIKDYASVKESINRNFIMYALYTQRDYGYQEWIHGRLKGMLYVAVMSGAITLDEYEFVDRARRVIALNRHKF